MVEKSVINDKFHLDAGYMTVSVLTGWMKKKKDVLIVTRVKDIIGKILSINVHEIVIRENESNDIYVIYKSNIVFIKRYRGE